MRYISTLSEICRLSTLKFTFLFFVTFGLYPLYWLRDRQYFYAIAFKRAYWNEEYPILILGVTGLTQIIGTFELGLYSPYKMTFFDFTGIYVYIGFWIYWCFKMRTAILEYLEDNFKFYYKINPYLTALLGPFYIVYKINNLNDEYETYVCR